jgi:20S proteasome alpha/beta subunit
MRVEDEYIGSETCVKIDSLGGHWVCIMSGSQRNTHRLVGLYRTILNDVNLRVSSNNLVDVMSTAPRQLLTKLSQELIHDELRISQEEFYGYGEKALGNVYRDLLCRIKELRLGCQLIIAGFLNGKAHLIQIEEDGQAIWNEHYVLIGSGTYEAHSILQQRTYVRTVELLDAIYLVYEAKRWSEKAKGVGDRNTSLQVLSPSREGFEIGWVDPLVGIPFLEEKYKAFNLQPIAMGEPLPSKFFR